MLQDVRTKQNCELERDALMAVARRGRHEELSVDQLVTRRVSLAALDELLDLFERPAAIADCGHGHNVLGDRERKQLGMPDSSRADHTTVIQRAHPYPAELTATMLDSATRC